MKEVNLITPSPIEEVVGHYAFLGEISNNDFITYANLATPTGVSQGTVLNEGSGWLRFELDDMELIVSKKSVRQTISWDQLDSVGCVFGTKAITIGGNQYKVRLLTGADTNPTGVNNGGYLEGSHNSEWSRLFYPIITDDPYIPAGKQGTHGDYKQTDLGLKNDGYQWCQETRVGYANQRVVRGHINAAGLYFGSSSDALANRRWRPCLERIK